MSRDKFIDHMSYGGETRFFEDKNGREDIAVLQDERVASSDGARGFRYYNDYLQYATETYETVSPAGTENPHEHSGDMSRTF